MIKLKLKERIKRLKEEIYHTKILKPFDRISDYFIENHLTNQLVNERDIKDEDIKSYLREYDIKKCYFIKSENILVASGKEVYIYDYSSNEIFVLSLQIGKVIRQYM